jgi:Holliday junction resolvase
MPLNARQKGKRVERSFRDVLRIAGYCKARRGQQFSGEQGNPDVVCEELPSIHWEVKGVQNSSPHKWLGQATNDSKGEKTPVVAWKSNNKDWVAFIYMDDLLEIIRRSDLPMSTPERESDLS